MCCHQAKKRKLGLLENDETSDLVEEDKGGDDVGTTAKVRGELVHNFYPNVL